MSTVHVPVLLNEVLEWLQPRPRAVLVDGTLGGGGHTGALAQAVQPGGQIIAIDRDPAAVERAAAALTGLPVQASVASYDELPEVLAGAGIELVDGILLDLGLSSDQLQDAERGFSYALDGPLDLRFDPLRGPTAAQLLAQLAERELANLIYRYGEERFSRRIARRIVEARHVEPIRTSGQLAELLRRCVPRGKHHRIDPATRTFQALRIAVNDELGILERALQRLPALLRSGGRLAIISFHSLEDRLVKQAFRSDPRLEVLTKKPQTPGDAEVEINPRSRSAKLRVAQRI